MQHKVAFNQQLPLKSQASFMLVHFFIKFMLLPSTHMANSTFLCATFCDLKKKKVDLYYF